MPTKNKHEIRLVDFRAVDNAENKMILEGYAITYDQPATHNYGKWEFTEVIKRGALNGADLKDVPLRYNHNDTFMVIARTRNQSLKLLVDDTGLKIVAELIDTQSNRDIYKSVQAGLIDKMSFAFDVVPGTDKITETGDMTYREVNQINRIYDVSVVDCPFYDTTSVYARSVELLESALHKPEGLELRKQKMKLKFTYGKDI